MEIIAELGNTHDGSIGQAKCMIDAAAEAGATSVKVQTHIFHAESTPNAPAPPYFTDESRKSYFERTAFSMDDYHRLIEHAHKNDVKFFSAAFSKAAVDILADLGLPYIKIPSGEVTNLPLIAYAATSNIPLIISSGMSDWRELDRAVAEVEKQGGLVECIMQCTSMYPTPSSQVGVNVVKEIIDRYGVAAGLSDHTLSSSAAVCSVYTGASFIEKHFTLSRKMYGSDAFNSLEPDEFASFCDLCREAMVMRNSPVDKSAMLPKIEEMKLIFEKSLVADCDIKAGTPLTDQNIAEKKPGGGMSPGLKRRIVGETLKVDVLKDCQIKADMFRDDLAVELENYDQSR